MYDTAGQERFKNITSNYYKAADGVFIVYDVHDRETFDSVRGWVANLDMHGKVDVQKYLVASKCDLEHKVSEEEGRDMAKRFGMAYIETSALTNHNVAELFVTIST